MVSLVLQIGISHFLRSEIAGISVQGTQSVWKFMMLFSNTKKTGPYIRLHLNVTWSFYALQIDPFLWKLKIYIFHVRPRMAFWYYCHQITVLMYKMSVHLIASHFSTLSDVCVFFFVQMAAILTLYHYFYSACLYSQILTRAASTLAKHKQITTEN